MGKEIESVNLASALRDYQLAYLITVDSDDRSHVAPLSPILTNGQFVVDGLGRRSRANVSTQPIVTLLWPPATPDGYSLIVDGKAVAQGDGICITPTRAVLHRGNAPEQNVQSDADAGACQSDCMALSFRTVAL